MKVKTRAGDIKEVNSNGVEVKAVYKDVDNTRKHKQVLVKTKPSLH